tara:strand:+ start:1434 stop:7745 length:6312 start_codon:yes stop_codon:yes gene_type:complete
MTNEAINLVNAGVSESSISYDYNAINDGLSVSERADVFTEVSVNPVLKSENLTVGANKSFIEIRKTATFANDIPGAEINNSFHNRVYPLSATLNARAKNKEETKPFRIRTYDSDDGASNTTTNAKFSYLGTTNQLDLEDFDYFVLINPEIVGEANTTVVKPHFARITAIVGFDEFGDGFEFEPSYPSVIPKDTNFEIYKGPAKTDTSVVAVSYGLEGDADATTEKYDVVNRISLPTAYFYNDRLHEKDQLDYETKYAMLYRNKGSSDVDQNCWFMTEAKFDRTIQNIGRTTLDAILVDNTKDEATDYEPLNESGFLDAFYRDSSNEVRRFIYFDKREFKNNRVVSTYEISANSPKNRISKMANVKLNDNAGIAHLKYKEEDPFYIRSGIYNSTTENITAPHNVTHETANVIEMRAMSNEYDLKAVLGVDSIVEIDGYHYVINTVNIKAGGVQSFTTKARKLTSANTFTITSLVHTFSNKAISYSPFTISTSSKHRLNTTFSADTKVKTDEGDRITLDGRTIPKEKTRIYNSKISFNNNLSFYIDLEKADGVHKYIEFADNTGNYYQSDYPFMYYLNGSYTLHETVFSGYVEDVDSDNDNGHFTFELKGRDEVGDLLSTNLTRNLNYLNDIVYSTSNPDVNSTSMTTGTISQSSPSLGTTVAIGDTSILPTQELSVNPGDLLYNSNNELIGEVLSTSNTIIYLNAPALKATSSSTIRIYKNTNSISALKAMISNNLETTRTTDFTSISDKGLVYSTGLDRSGNALVSTSDTGSFSEDGSLGYAISGTNSTDGDSVHLLHVGLDDGYESNKQVKRTYNVENFSVVDIQDISDPGDSNNLVKLAPTLPVVLGRLDNGKFYHVNTNIPYGGYLHKLVSDSNTVPKSEQLYRYYNSNRFASGSLNYSHDSVYADASNRTQKISGYSDLIHFSDDIGGTTANYTTSSNSSSPKNANITTGSGHVPKEIFYESALRQEPLSALTQIDRKTIPYELYGLGDILPFSYKRANSIGREALGMTNFGVMFEDEKTGVGSQITHTNYDQITKYRTKSDRNYGFSTISSSNIDTNQMRRWGVMRLVEATFDWHFNPIDAESLRKTSEIPKVKYPLYHRYVFDGSSFLAGRNSSGNLTFETNQSFVDGDILYNSDGRIIAVFNDSISGTSLTPTQISQNTSYSNVALLTEDEDDSLDSVRKVILNTSTIVHDDGEGLNGNDDANAGTFVYVDNLTETENLQTLIDVHLLVPTIDRDYLVYAQLDHFTDPPNVVLPLWAQFNTNVSTILALDTNDVLVTDDDYPSLYPVNRMATSGFIHTSKVIHAILNTKPVLTYDINNDLDTMTYDSHGLTHYDFDGTKHLYENCRLQFTDFKPSLQSTILAPIPDLTSSDVTITNITGTVGGLSGNIDSQDMDELLSFYPSETLMTLGYVWQSTASSTDSRRYSLTLDDNGSTTFVQGQSFVAPATTTTHYVNEKRTDYRDLTLYDNDGLGNEGLFPSHSKGHAYRAQMFVKPILTLSSSEILSTTVDKVMNSSTDALWLEFVPNLTGYYLVEDTDDTTVSIAKITSHTRSVSSNNIATHRLIFDNTLVAGDYRVMRVSETTFENTPDKIEFNKLFDTGLQYDNVAQDIRFSEKRDRKTKYQEGIHSMFLFVDIDNLDDTNANGSIDRRNIAGLDSVFTNGEQIDVYVTDGKTKQSKTVTVNTTGSDFSMTYDGSLTGDGVVSFGEIFEIVIPKSLAIQPSNAYIGTTFSVGSEIETEIADILKEIDLDLNSTQSLLHYTGAMVNSGGLSNTNTITYTGTNDIVVGDVLYTHEGYLLGKVSAINTTTITFESKEFVPAQYDEIIRRKRKTFISLSNFEDVDAFSVLNSLITQKGLDYTIEDERMVINRLDDRYGLRTYKLDYLTNNRIVSVESNKSLFDKANKVIVVGDGVRAEAEVPTKKRTRQTVVVDPNVKSLNDARIKAEQTLQTVQQDARKIRIKVQKEGMELIKPGDIVSLDFPNHDIPKGDYQVFEIENALTSLITLSVNTFNKSIAERLSELGVEQRVGIGKILTRNSEQEVVGKLFLDTVMIKNVSVKYQVSRNENALGFNNTLGFNSQLGLDITDDTPYISERDE